MKNYLKFFVVFILTLTLFPLVFFSACDKESDLLGKVSELKSDAFYGESQNYKIKAGYGFSETPTENDGKVNATVYALSFKLLEKETDNATYVLSLDYGGNTFKSVFALNPVSNALCCSISIEDFTEKSFTVKIFCADASETVTLSSTVPKNAMDYKQAILSLEKNQKNLIDSYRDNNGNFTAELVARIIVKDQKPYWYIGIKSGNGNLKALLIDGVSGEVLAIREVF